MSLNWNFENDFIGIAYRGDRMPEFVYTGNAMMIFNSEYPWRGPFGDQEPNGEWGYSLCNFYADKEHLKKCIKDKIYDGSEYSLIILKPCKEAYDFIKIINGLWDVQITSHNDEFMKKVRENYRKVGYKK